MPIKELKLGVNKENFWKSMGILITKPFAINKSIAGCDVLHISNHYPTDLIVNGVLKIIESKPKSYETLRLRLSDHFKVVPAPVNAVLKALLDSSVSEENEPSLLLRLVCPRNDLFRCDVIDFITCDFINCEVEFMKIHCTDDRPLLLVDIPFKFKYNQDLGILTLSSSRNSEEFSASLNFLTDTVFNKVSTWMKSNLKDQVYSLSLVPVDRYVVQYNELKRKYVKRIEEIWTECTNFEKFIHEDIAIASYLILLWNCKPVRFVDLGCGNGLLVYILNSEGHLGHGIDVRYRKIWSKYPKEVYLKEKPITPSDNFLFPNTDWIIGNHSDELTPWIPVIAFRSSIRTNFFLLPCCAYEFDGRKFSRSNTNKSQYLSYMDYVEKICEKCGFSVHRDRLRIPSTKRTCFISRGRTYCSESERLNIDNQLIEFITEKSVLSLDKTGKWLDMYKPREYQEKVRNCTQLDRKLINDLIQHVSNLLLSTNHTSDDTNKPTWNEGKPTKLFDIVKTVPKELLSQLKNECGGLQTLLKNNHQIFKFHSDGYVTFRKPVEKDCSTSNVSNWKKRPCWFYSNHPDSCPLLDINCPFSHEVSN